MTDCEVILEYVYAELKALGGKSLSYHLATIVSPHATGQSVIWARGVTLADQRLYVREFREEDPVPQLAFRYGPVLLWRDAERLAEGDEKARDHMMRLRQAGFDNWVGFALYGPRERDAFASVRFGSEPANLPAGVLATAHHRLEATHLRICELLEDEEPAVLLSARERSVMNWIAQGLTNVEVAAKLDLSPETVRTYTKRVYEKLGVNDRVTATVRALRLGLLEI